MGELMAKLVLLVLVILALPMFCHAAEVYLDERFDKAGTGFSSDDLMQVPDRGSVLQISVPAGTANPGKVVAIPLPIGSVRGKQVFFGADVKADDVSKKPNSWNGIKVMLVIKSPSGTVYPQADLPVGSFDWKRASSSASIPADADSVTLVLGLEQVTGKAWFDNARVALRKVITVAPPAPADKPIYKGHDLPRLRGAMVGNIGQSDLEHFAKDWNGNLIRWQLVEGARQDRPLDKYDE